MSKLVFFTEDNELIEQNLDIADDFMRNDIFMVILARYNTIEILQNQLPRAYKDAIKFVNRTPETVYQIKHYNKQNNIYCMIGVVENDAIFAFQCKIPLFNPEQMFSELVVSEKVKRYGLPIQSFSEVVACLKAFDIHKENYFGMYFENFNVISLNNANTFFRPDKEVEVKKIFEVNLKGNESRRDQRILLLLLFHLINEVSTNPFYDKVDYWGTFPSSDPDNTETSVSFIKEALRIIVNGGPRSGPEILIRHSHMRSKHSSDPNVRVRNRSDKDFETLIVNPSVVKRIQGKVVCIIDDYITNGYSAEAAKHILLHAGAKEVIFLSFGKFGRRYTTTDYELDGDVSMEYNYHFRGEERYEDSINGDSFYNYSNDREILDFSELI